MTGLNIAIVKLQQFLKAQEETQRRWVERAVKRTEQKAPALLVDEEMGPQFRKDVKKECEGCLNDINKEKMWCWSFWSRWAIRMSVLGFVCMGFQYSAGILMFPMAAPVVGTWLLSRKIRHELFSQMKGVDRLLPLYIQKLKESNQKKGKELEEAIEKAEQATAPPKKEGR